MEQADASSLHRAGDPDTSRKAAQAILPVRFTIRLKVEDFAKGLPQGFIDEDLEWQWPDTTGSTLRTRRSELAQDGIILDSGRRRVNSKGREQIVWLHRSFHPNPPPIRQRQPELSKAHQIVTLEAKVRRLEYIMRQAIAVHAADTGFSSTAAQMADILKAELKGEPK